MGVPGWLSGLSVQLLIFVQVMILWFVNSSPMFQLCADSVEPAWDSLSLPLSALPNPSQNGWINFKKKKKKKKLEVMMN